MKTLLLLTDVLWSKVLVLVEAYFEGAADKQQGIRNAEKELSELRQEDEPLLEYISEFKGFVRKMLRAGGTVTDQRMIQLCLQESSSITRDGFGAYITQVKLNGNYNGREFTEWTAFMSVMGRIGTLSAETCSGS